MSGEAGGLFFIIWHLVARSLVTASCRLRLRIAIIVLECSDCYKWLHLHQDMLAIKRYEWVKIQTNLFWLRQELRVLQYLPVCLSVCLFLHLSLTGCFRSVSGLCKLSYLYFIVQTEPKILRLVISSFVFWLWNNECYYCTFASPFRARQLSRCDEL